MLVSVITPLFNAEDWLKTTVLSLQEQTYTDWEMIIVDDLSTDNSYQIAQDLAATDNRIKVFQLDINGGASLARNKSIELAKGRYIAFLDSDDLWHPEKLEKQITFMQKYDHVFTYTAYEKINEDSVPFQIMGVPEKVNYHDLLKTCVIGCLTVIYDTEKLGKVYMPINTRREDFATWLKILKKVDYAYGINEPLAQYRVYAEQSSSKKISMAKENWRLYREIEDLGLLRSSYYFMHYAFAGLLRTRLPKLAKLLGVLD